MAKCYRCGAKATSREHYPPKGLFPKNSKLQLKTVPSCDLHNTARSGDDQYFLAHIAMNCSREGNMARDLFKDKILPQIRQSGGYAAVLINGSRSLGDGTRAYRVDVERIDRVLDGICHATFYERFGVQFDDSRHSINHAYPNFTSEDASLNAQRASAKEFIEQFAEMHPDMNFPHSQRVNNQPVYAYNFVAPIRDEGSITIYHTFFGTFNVVSYLTRKWEGPFAEALEAAASLLRKSSGSESDEPT
jgi:hypothetical protein